MNRQKVSIFTQHYNRLMEINNSEDLHQEITTIVAQSKINATDKNKVLRDVSNLNSLIKLQTYLTNSMLKYQGLGTIK
jgi:hypothetical protein